MISLFQHRRIRQKQIGDAKKFYKYNPSDERVTSAWIYALRKRGKYSQPIDSGKWLIFLETTKIDGVWKKIKVAVESGKLGEIAKVSPVNRARIGSFSRKPEHVICVYTYDWNDQADVMRIRDMLTKLGITWPISYKTDADTRAGKYANRGDRNISKYRV